MLLVVYHESVVCTKVMYTKVVCTKGGYRHSYWKGEDFTVTHVCRLKH